MTPTRATFLTVLCLHLTMLGCRTGGAVPETAAAPQAAASAPAPAPAPTPAAPPTTPEPAPQPVAVAPQVARAVHFALDKHVERAELSRGNVRLFDYGVPGDAKYSLGGWLTSSGEGRSFGQTRAMYMRGSLVKLALPAVDTGAHSLVLRLRSFTKTPLTIYVNGATVADEKLDGNDFQTLVVPLAAAKLKLGENKLELRATQALSTRADGGFAIDYLALAPAAVSGSASEIAPPPSPSELTGTDSQGSLRIPAGLSLGYTLEVPSNALLEATVRAPAPARLSVTALRDGAPAVALGTIEASSTPSAMTLDLSGLAGHVTRIELAADGGAVELASPRVTVVQPASAELKRKPIKNVIVLLIDTLRADKLSPYNPKTRVQTPGLSRFLRGASVMLNARTQENWTKPSVATLLSSLMPWEHNTFTDDAKLPAAVDTLPELLRKHGYATGAFIANGYVSDKFGFEQGFGSYRNYVREGRRNVAQYVAADVLEWLDKRQQDKPFFLYVHTIDPHVPYMPPEHFLAKYDAQPYAGIVNFKGNSELLEKIKIGSIKLSDRDKQRLTALYDGEISYHDVHFAAIMDGLQSRGLAEETMVVITSDHGEEFWDHGSVGHGHSVYDELLHIPMIVRIPGVTEGKDAVPTNVGLVDVVPTVFDTLGLPMPQNLSGTSFLPDLLGERADAPRATPSGFMTAWRTLAVGKLKFVQKGEARFMLYDVARDPGETQDISTQSPIAVRYARGLLGLTLKGSSQSHQAPRKIEAEKTKIDPQTEAQLRALGYVGTSRP